MIELPKVGVGVMVRHKGKILLGKRIGAHGEGTWSFPGGHLEFREEIFECAEREAMEEVGIKITNLENTSFTNDIFLEENKHYVTLFVVCDYLSGEVKVMEPTKCEEWGWFDWEKLPKPLFLPIHNLLKQHYSPF